MAEQPITGKLNYNTIIEYIRTAIFGKNVREAIAQGIEHCHDLSIDASGVYDAANTLAQNANNAITGAESAAARANTAAANAEHVNAEINKSNGVISITVTNKNNQSTTKTVTDPASMLDDTSSANNKIWSASKIQTELNSLAAYEKIVINSFTPDPATAEVGSTVTSITFSYSLNKNAAVIKVDGTTVSNTSATGTITKTGSWTGSTPQNSVSFVLSVTDERNHTPPTKTASMVFQNRVYYGVSSVPSSLNSSFVTGLASKIFDGNTRKRTISVNAGSGKYIYYAVPTRLGACTFTVGGFTGGFTLAGTVSVKNASNYSENYYVYKSDNANLGSTSVVVS